LTVEPVRNKMLVTLPLKGVNPMRLRTGALVVGLVCVFTAATAGAVWVAPAAEPPQEQQKAGQTYTIKIFPDLAHPENPPRVVPEDQPIERNDQVEWVCKVEPDEDCPEDVDFLVVFTEPGRKPFKDRGFSKGKNKSGKPTGPKGKYKYSVIVGEGVADPRIIVG
jgi:hypothetical protein